jgi:hypothetical protein
MGPAELGESVSSREEQGAAKNQLKVVLEKYPGTAAATEAKGLPKDLE